jgi:hypothetical protein
MRFSLGIVAVSMMAVTSARSLLGAVNLANRVAHGLLDARQAPNTTINLPQECQSTCNPVLTAINNVRLLAHRSTADDDDVHNLMQVCTPSQCCTSSFEQQLFNCFTCLVNVTGSSNYTTGQNTVDGES